MFESSWITNVTITIYILPKWQRNRTGLWVHRSAVTPCCARASDIGSRLRPAAPGANAALYNVRGKVVVTAFAEQAYTGTTGTLSRCLPFVSRWKEVTHRRVTGYSEQITMVLNIPYPIFCLPLRFLSLLYLRLFCSFSTVTSNLKYARYFFR